MVCTGLTVYGWAAAAGFGPCLAPGARNCPCGLPEHWRLRPATLSSSTRFHCGGCPAAQIARMLVYCWLHHRCLSPPCAPSPLQHQAFNLRDKCTTESAMLDTATDSC